MKSKKNILAVIATVIIVALVCFIWGHTNTSSSCIEIDGEEERSSAIYAEPYNFLDEIREGSFNGLKIVTGTVYNPVNSQCDSTPLVTADGSKIDPEALKNGEIRWIAVSRDLLGEFNYGDKVEILTQDGDPWGVFEIHDTMHTRWYRRIDFLMPENINSGRWENLIIKKVVEQN